MQTKRSAQSYPWRFFRAGGFDQVKLDSAQDLLNLHQLDQKLWVALTCPVNNVHFDTRTLALIDTDGDKRIRPAELIAALQWTGTLLSNPDALTDRSAQLSLDALSDATPQGQTLRTALSSTLAALGKSATDALSLTELESLESILCQKPYNGDGIVTAESAEDEQSRQLIGEIIQVVGAVADRSQKPGIGAEQVESFFTQARAYAAWHAEGLEDSTLQPLGDGTASAATVLDSVRGKIDDYFARCAVASYDPKAQCFLNGGDKHYELMGSKALTLHSTELLELPLAPISAGAPLPFDSTINPAWTAQISRFQREVVAPLLGAATVLTPEQWQLLQEALSPWQRWVERKPNGAFDTLGSARVEEILSSPLQQTLDELITRDRAEATTFAALESLEKLVRFRRDLHALCLNFVNFKDFYSMSEQAIFQAGTLYLDQRSCSLCLKIDDVGKHAAMAAMAGTYLAYCECKRPGGATMTIVAAFTNGDSDNIIVGRNGIFYDRTGNDWDATITKIIENPISLRQAFWLPYKNLVRMIESQVAKRATAADAQATATLEKTAVATANVDAPKAAPAKKLDIGIVAALGVAAGALGTFVATLLGYVSGIVNLGPIAIVGAVVGLLLLISGPSLILAYIKLRKRNLGPLLDASGWAVNAKARINVPFGAMLTHIATLPPGAQRDLKDPYAEKKSPWPTVALVGLLLYLAYFACDQLGFVNEWSRGRVGIKKGAATTVAPTTTHESGGSTN
jgi:hypothetical protein